MVEHVFESRGIASPEAAKGRRLVLSKEHSQPRAGGIKT
jgi:hypothetical protein